jgi:hypothetical protein
MREMLYPQHSVRDAVLWPGVRLCSLALEAPINIACHSSGLLSLPGSLRSSVRRNLFSKELPFQDDQIQMCVQKDTENSLNLPLFSSEDPIGPSLPICRALEYRMTRHEYRSTRRVRFYTS